MKGSYNFTLTKAEWESAILAMIPKPPPEFGPITWSFDSAWNLVAFAGTPDIPVTTPVVPPVVVSIAVSAGHMIVSEPPLRADGKATMFGLDWNGATDAGDNGIGFFTDPSTKKPFNTRTKLLMGASLPREILLSSFGISDDWKVPSLSDANTSEVWAKHASAVRDFALTHQVGVNIDSGGLSLRDVPLVDAGPEAIGPNNCCIGNLVDLTYMAAHALNTNGDARASIELLIDGVAVPILGWNNVLGRVA